MLITDKIQALYDRFGESVPMISKKSRFLWVFPVTKWCWLWLEETDINEECWSVAIASDYIEHDFLKSALYAIQFSKKTGQRYVTDYWSGVVKHFRSGAYQVYDKAKIEIVERKTRDYVDKAYKQYFEASNQ